MFTKGQKVRCLSNPYAPILEKPLPGEIGEITDSGEHFVGIRFGDFKAKMWLVEDANGNQTIELIKG